MNPPVPGTDQIAAALIGEHTYRWRAHPGGLTDRDGLAAESKEYRQTKQQTAWLTRVHCFVRPVVYASSPELHSRLDIIKQIHHRNKYARRLS
jgi:hypothetical protein